jgi:fructose-1,6-bisphosphatase-3
MRRFADADGKYLRELAKSYPNRNAVSSEIINLNAILNLPKGTEHFMSDIHGEHEAFLHIRRNASGAIRRKIDSLFGDELSSSERSELATLIYYPEEKLDKIKDVTADINAWYKTALVRLLKVCRLISGKYTRSKVRKNLAKTARGYDYILDELLNENLDEPNKEEYYENIIDTIIEIGSAEQVIIAFCSAIKGLVIDHLHIVGDIFDRGPRADIIVDELMKENSLDIQWGNHDILWLGAAAGSRTCIATVVNNSITYKNLDVIEIGYGISLRQLSLFANEVYRDSDVSNYMPKGNSGGNFIGQDDDLLIARMHKAISVLQFKLEGQIILRNPEFDMNDRLLLDKIDWQRGTVTIGGTEYALTDTDFPTVDPQNPYELTHAESEIMRYLKNAFMRSEKLQKHARFLFEAGEMYTVYNQNLLFHGCIPLDDNGELLKLGAAGGRSGKALMDYCDRVARQGYFAKEGSNTRRFGKDFLWFLWCGKDSPLCARKRITTFERMLIADQSTWSEPKNAYYTCWNDEGVAEKILKEFSLGGDGSHIINGHIPIKYGKGEDPVKANGKLIVIDGGFCKAYRDKTGIAGYTLVYSADGLRISAHEPFFDADNAIHKNSDIISETVVFESAKSRIKVKDTDNGKRISQKISDLMLLLVQFENGAIKERFDHKK